MPAGPDEALLARTVEVVRRVQAMPYVWPSPPDAESVRKSGGGSCSSKHALLAEELEAIGVRSLPLLAAGRLVPQVLRRDPAFAPGLTLLEVHEYLTVLTPWAGPLRVDATWDPPLVAHGLPGTLEWGGRSDMQMAIGEVAPCWAAPRDGLREAKEALRARLYRPGERAARDEVLRRLSERFAEWRAEKG